MEGEGEEAAGEEGHITWPFKSSGVECRGEQDGHGRQRSNSVLVSEVKELIMCVSWRIELIVEADDDGLDGTGAVAPEVEEVVEDPPYHPAEIVSFIMSDRRGEGAGGPDGGKRPERTALWTAVGEDEANCEGEEGPSRLRE
jgi:hypothetical protein